MERAACRASGSIANESTPVPPVGVYLVAGCGADLFINICLTVLAYVYIEGLPTCLGSTLQRLPTTNTPSYRFLPGHIHAFYVEYVYYDRAEQAREGRFAAKPAPGVYSERVQTGGHGYGTMAQPTN